MDKFEKREKCDIIIDYKHNNSIHEFTGNNYKINENISSNFHFALLFDIGIGNTMCKSGYERECRSFTILF